MKGGQKIKNKVSDNKTRIVGIDYARAFFSVCVVGIHIGYFLPSYIFDPEIYFINEFSFSDFVNFYILSLAVPAFLIISNYLFSCKPYDWRELSKTLVRCVKLVFFWSLIYIIIENIPMMYPPNVMTAVMMILSAYGTIYYFFISLAILTIITHFAKRLPNFLLLLLAVLSIIIVGILPILSIKYQFYFLSFFWNPINFLPLPFAAIIIQRLKSQNLRRLYWNLIIISLIVLAFFAGILDWTIYVNKGFFTVNIYAIPAFTRPSLVLLSVLVLVLVVNFQMKKLAVIDFMAKHSLALYCLHCFFLSMGVYVSTIFHLTGVISWLTSITIVTITCYILSLILPYFLNKDIIR